MAGNETSSEKVLTLPNFTVLGLVVGGGNSWLSIYVHAYSSLCMCVLGFLPSVGRRMWLCLSPADIYPPGWLWRLTCSAWGVLGLAVVLKIDAGYRFCKLWFRAQPVLGHMWLGHLASAGRKQITSWSGQDISVSAWLMQDIALPQLVPSDLSSSADSCFYPQRA